MCCCCVNVQHPFIRDVADMQPLIELVSEASHVLLLC